MNELAYSIYRSTANNIIIIIIMYSIPFKFNHVFNLAFFVLPQTSKIRSKIIIITAHWP